MQGTTISTEQVTLQGQKCIHRFLNCTNKLLKSTLFQLKILKNFVNIIK